MNYNLIIGLILLALSILCSIELSKKYTIKRKFFSDFNDFNQLLIKEISFSKRTIPSIINDKNDGVSMFYSILYKKFIKKEKVNLGFLSEKEQDFFNNYLNSIIMGESIVQIKYLEDYCSQIKSLLDLASSNEGKYKPLIIKIGVMIGLLLLIIII